MSDLNYKIIILALIFIVTSNLITASILCSTNGELVTNKLLPMTGGVDIEANAFGMDSSYDMFSDSSSLFGVNF